MKSITSKAMKKMKNRNKKIIKKILKKNNYLDLRFKY